MVAAVLVLLTVIPLAKFSTGRIITAVTFTILSAFLFYLHIPVLILWVAVCLVKTMMEKQWVLAGLIASTAILPLGSGTGSPTYTVFVLMICSFATANNLLFIRDSAFFKRLSFSLLVIFCICLVTIKTGHRAPVITSFVRPVLAEQEKTRQLKNIIEWKLNNTSYQPYCLQFTDGTDLPISSNNSISRQNRPVTTQQDLDLYVQSLSGESHDTVNCQYLYITFGDKTLAGKKPVLVVNGKWNGKAYVYK
jgi:hypothetical protein